MLKTHAVGIDLGTTYSCLSYLNEHGEPVTLPNQEGEMTTPSIVMFDGKDVIVGTEALRTAVLKPTHVVQNAKRYIGSNKTWTIEGKDYTPVDVGALVLRKMLDSAREQIGEVTQAVITVPAQFSDWQRQATVEMGFQAGLKRVDIINEPVAAALCYVLGSEGLWFTELTDEQRILVYDLGGGTFDLSLVKYHTDEVKVLASTGDLRLGGIDWNEALQEAICDRFAREFGDDPRRDPESMQLLAMAVENTKRSLTVRPRAALTCSHGKHRKVYQIELPEFEKLTKPLIDRTIAITRDLQKAYQFGIKQTDTILTTGGSSRMPSIKKALGELGFRTLNTSLSPDQSISHGATYYAGMLLTNADFAKSILSPTATAKLQKIKQHSVNARALGILIRDTEKNTRIPHFLIPANSELPTSITQTFGTVIPNQRRVNLHIVESGTVADQRYVELGTCIVEDLPKNLPEQSLVEVTITYNEQARVLVTAKDVTSGKQAQTVIVRQENVVAKKPSSEKPAAPVADEDAQAAWTSPSLKATSGVAAKPAPPNPNRERQATAPAAPQTQPAAKSPASATKPGQPLTKPAPTKQQTIAGPKSALSGPRLEESNQPIPLCNECGEALNFKGICPACGWNAAAKKPLPGAKPPVKPTPTAVKPGAPRPPAVPTRSLAPPTKPAASKPKASDDDELIEMAISSMNKPTGSAKPPIKKPPVKKGEDEFWKDEK
ncbi:MAG: Hsp70 family protein [Planctomycetaceae bacterium]|nr:Hsp70 family protein [Planctomycetaceae bacterium]